MDGYDDELMEELIAESKEHLEAIEPDLLGLEENPDAVSPDVINRIFRAVHSIKGGFGFFSMNHIKDLAHVMENVMGLIRDGELKVQPKIVDALLSGADKLRVLIDDIHASEDIPIEEEVARFTAILNAQGKGAEAPPEEAAAPPPPTVEQPAQNDAGDPVEFGEAMGLLKTEGAATLSGEDTARLGELFRALHDMTTEEGMELAEDIVADYEICVNTIGLDGILREGIADKLEKLRHFLPIHAPESASSPALNTPVNAAAQADATAPAKTAPAPGAPAAASEAAKNQSLRVRVDLLDELMNLAGELVLSRNRIKLTLADKLSACMVVNPSLKRFLRQLDDSHERLEAAAHAFGNGSAQRLAGAVAHEFGSINAALRQFMDTSLSDLPQLAGAVQDIDTVTSELQGGIMGTRMQPVGAVFSKFPRVIRDMNRKLGKEIELAIQGQNVELDKSIIEALGDPLTHLIRNSADHGIEAPDARKAAGKPAQGKIELIARHEGGQVYIEIIDDGAGIDPEKIKRKAIERNMLSEADASEMSDREALRLIFAPGFSTAEQISDVSGRGVGMDVVRSNIEGIGGTVDISSTLGKGSRVAIKLPLTLAIMPALVIESAGRVFAVPQVDIEELVRIRAQDVADRIETIHGRPVMRLRERVLPLTSLNQILGLESTVELPGGTRQVDRRTQIADRRSPELDPGALIAEAAEAESESREDLPPRSVVDRRSNPRSAFNVIVLRVGPNQFGLIVETLRDSEEIVVKPLSGYLKNCPAYAGATIMGDGRVAMILDAAGMAERAELRFGGALEKAELALSGHYSQEDLAEKQTLLIFRNGTSERFSINLSMVRRIEKVHRSAIEQVDDKEFLKYESSSLRLLRLHDFLPVDSPEQECEYYFVIVPKLVRHPMGIAVRAVEDVLETDAALDGETITGTGILGSFVIDGMLVIDIDIYSLFEAAEPEIYSTRTADVLRGKRVLLAEDTAFFRTTESAYLSELGCDVEVAVDGEEAWAKLAEKPFDLLVTDIEMPRLDGIALTARVRADEQHKHLPVVALTSLTNESDRKRILDSGVDAYEAKLDKESLREVLERLVSR